MNPVALHIGPLAIRWYGIFVALGFLSAFIFAGHRARKRGIPTDVVSDLLFWTMVAAILGARALFVIQNWADFSGNLAEIVRIDHGGLVFYGGFFGAILAVILLCRIRKLKLYEIADLLAPVVPLGQVFGRVGCFLNGCCYGHDYEGPLAAHYSLPSPPYAPGSVFSVFPIQLAYSLTNILTVITLVVLEKRFNLKGRLFGLFMIIYGTVRFGLEFARGDYAPADRWGALTPAQGLCLFVIPAGAFLFWFGGSILAAGKDNVPPAVE